MLAIRPGDHIGTTFASPAQFAATTVAFTEQAIGAGALIMIFPGDPDRQDTAGYGHHLGERSSAVAAAAARGQVQIGDSHQVQLAPGHFDPDYLRQAYAAATARALTAGYRGLWVSVDMSWAAAVDPAALTAFEAAAFSLFTSGDLTAICQYDEHAFPPATASAACAAHPAALDSPRPLRHRRAGDTLVLSGETDLTNRTAFATLLGSLRPGDTLDITGMTFVDVRGLVAITDRRTRLPDLTVRATHVHSQMMAFILGDTDDRGAGASTG